MKKLFRIYPTVPGHFGEDTVMDVSVHPPMVSKLHYVFDGWLGDDLIQAFPCYMCTENLKIILKESGLTGIEFDNCRISKSLLFEDIHPNRELPKIYWLKITGTVGCDFFLKDKILFNSEKALNTLQRANLNFCRIEAV